MGNAQESYIETDKTQPGYINLDIVSIIKLLWGQKFLLLSVVSLFIAISVAIALALDEMYTVELKAVPSETSLATTDNSLQATIALRLGGFGGAVSAYEKHLVAVQVLRSTGFIYNFVKKHNITPLLFGVKEWDKNSGSLIWNEDIYDPSNESWIIDEPPSAQEATRKFLTKHLSVDDNRKSRMLTLQFTHQSPIVAAEIVNSLLMDLNQTMKNKELSNLDKKLSFYKEKLATTNINSERTTITTLIEQLTYDQLLIKTNDDFLFEVIDPPMIPEQRSQPRRGLIVIVGSAFSCLLALIIAFGRVLILPPASFSKTRNW